MSTSRHPPVYLTKASEEKNEITEDEEGDLDHLLKKIKNELNSSQDKPNRSDVKRSPTSSKSKLMSSPTAHDLRELFQEESASKDMEPERVFPKDTRAFQLKLLCEAKIFDAVVEKKMVPEIESWWEGDFARYRIARSNFKFLPDTLSNKISREHATIVGYRSRHNKTGGQSDLNFFPNQKEEGNIIGRLFSSLIEPKEKDDVEVEENKAKTSPEKGIEEKHFAIFDESPNKIYVLKEHKYGLISSPREKIEGQFRKLSVGERMELNHLDIIAIKLDLKRREMIFGFQFLSENLAA